MLAHFIWREMKRERGTAKANGGLTRKERAKALQPLWEQTDGNKNQRVTTLVKLAKQSGISVSPSTIYDYFKTGDLLE